MLFVLAGFDKPWIIVSNKNEQKKHAVPEGEGQALANKGIYTGSRLKKLTFQD
jgi:hypothetical protein